jgi:tetratricopeptide (TPR) repeat protein
MSLHDGRRWLWTAVGLVALETLVFVFSCRIAAARGPSAGGGTSIIARLLGSGRVAVSGHFYEVADLYFHRGVGHQHARKARNDLFFRINAVLHPATPIHLAGHDVRDIMPWLRLATQIEPQNVEAYLVTAFWLGRMGERRAARGVLAEARRNNPFAEEIALEEGRLFLKEQDYGRAYASFSRCLALLDRAGVTNDEARYDQRAALLYKAAIEEMRHDTTSVVRTYARLLDLNPADPNIRARCERMRAGGPVAGASDAAIQSVLASEDAKRAECRHDDEP